MINKIYEDRYEVETYYRVGKIDKYYKSNTIFNSEQIEELIKEYLYLYNCEIEVEYK